MTHLSQTFGICVWGWDCFISVLLYTGSKIRADFGKEQELGRPGLGWPCVVLDGGDNPQLKAAEKCLPCCQQ